MQRDFALAVTPIFDVALRWIDTIADPNRPSLKIEDIQDAHSNILATIKNAKSKLERKYRDRWDLIEYAIVAWIDEQCRSLNWEGRNWWENNSLELSRFSTKNSHDAFFEKAEEAMRDRDAIEIYFLCVVLGFRGIYMDLRHQDAAYVERAKDFVSRRNLPSDLRDWLKRASDMIPLGHSSGSLDLIEEESSGISPLSAKLSLISSLLFLSISLGGLIAYFLFTSR
ncbi:MAG: DotU family type IV/VI secretion system protein [Planctomycetaceae bacterium]|nr:DotU family type IV/VI secretion system protein [Planctomycetaceae bacterium]